jgi:hypothetical protein
MARIEPEDLIDPERIFIAAKLDEALLVEEMLTGVGVEYAVQVEAFARSLFFGVRHGAAFYVPSPQAAWCRAFLTERGLERGVVEEQE